MKRDDDVSYKEQEDFLSVAAVAVTASSTIMMPAQAIESKGNQTEVLSEYSLDTLANKALSFDEFNFSGDSLITSEKQDTVVEVPLDADNPITISEKGTEDIHIELPFGETSSDAVTGDYGQVVFDHLNDSNTSVLPHEDGSVQLVTTLEGDTAPEEYAYKFDIPEGAGFTTLSDGSILINDVNGEFVAGLAAPWARDANGKDIATHYEIRGSELVQAIEHHSRSDLAYPVTADPWLGRDLIGSLWITHHDQGYRVNLYPTAWGRAFSGPATHSAHVDELKAKAGSWRVTPTIREQYLCHVVGNFLEWQDYNMESWLPYKPWAQQLNWNDQCNPGGNRYSQPQQMDADISSYFCSAINFYISNI